VPIAVSAYDVLFRNGERTLYLPLYDNRKSSVLAFISAYLRILAPACPFAGQHQGVSPQGIRFSKEFTPALNIFPESSQIKCRRYS